METAKSGFREKPACAEKYAPLPETFICQGCGREIELWSDEEESACPGCGSRIER